MIAIVPKHEPVAAVCGNQVRIYDGESDNGKRRLMKVIDFPHRGAALQYAVTHDDIVKWAYER